MTQAQPKPRGRKPKVTTGEAVGGMLTIRLPVVTHIDVATVAGTLGYSINKYVLRLIKADLEHRKVRRW